MLQKNMAPITSTSVTKRYSKIREEKASEALDSFFERINQ